jgi:hypothetical protein
MNWIVIGEEGGKIKLVSKNGTTGILPKGSFLKQLKTRILVVSSFCE